MAFTKRYLRDYLSTPITHFVKELSASQAPDTTEIFTSVFQDMGATAGPGLMGHIARWDKDNTWQAPQSFMGEGVYISVENTGGEEDYGAIRVGSGPNLIEMRSYPDNYTVDEDLAGQSILEFNSSSTNHIRAISTTNGTDALIIDAETGPIMTFHANRTIRFNAYAQGWLRVDETGNLISEEVLGEGGDVADSQLSENVPLLDNTINLFTGKISIGDLPDYANNAAAVSAGLTPGTLYRNGENVKVVTA